MALHIETIEQFDSQILNYPGLSMVDFRAERCGPCKMIGPIIEELSVDNAAKEVKIAKVDVDQLGALAGKLNISAIPTIIFFRAGQEVNRITGALPKAAFQQKIDELLTPMAA